MEMNSTKAQIHVIEISLGVLLFIAAMIFVGSFRVPQFQQSYSQIYLETVGNDVLRSFDLMPLPTNDSKYHNSNITYVLFGSGGWQEAGEESKLWKGFLKFLNITLPGDVSKNISYISYNLYLRNYTERITLYSIATPHNAVSASRTIVFEGIVYEIEILLWYEPR